MKNKVIESFKDIFSDKGDIHYSFAPGRVNLIGEHTDYNGGHVFPCALTLGTYIAGRLRDDRKLKMYSVNRGGESVTVSSLDELKPLADDGWTSYVKGVIWAFAEEGMRIERGMDLVIGGDIPAGAGLSSSASLEVAVGNLMRGMYELDTDNVGLALLGRKAENEYVGMNCGIMDQFASAMGRENRAIYLDTETLEYRYVPLDLGGRKIVITNTNKEHELANSAYNDRRRECAEVLNILKGECAKRGREIRTLGDLAPEEFEDVKGCISDPVLMRRARHAVYENARTLRAVAALENNDLDLFGELMNESHASLRDDYEVSCRELDVLAETSWRIKGVYGSRMTGGGFGGCTVSVIDENILNEYCEEISEVYKKAVGYDCTFYVVTAGGGPYSGISR